MFKTLKEKLRQLKEKIDVSEAKEKISALISGELVISEGKVDEILDELELALIESDVALEVVSEIREKMKQRLVGKRKKISESLYQMVENELKLSLIEILERNYYDFESEIERRLKEKRPLNIIFVGVNGTGKTTTIAKIAKMLMNKYKVIIVAADTFRAGAIEQLEEHGRRLGVKVIKHKQGSDPAAVIFDAIKHAESKGIDIILADTAGRMHTKKNLLDQLEKVKRVTKPDFIIFVDESIAGNDAVERSKMFRETIGIDGTILTKIDADAKGGTAISICYTTQKPILYLGTGQKYDDLIKFDAKWLVERIFS
ncbi:MAG: signal recognition particle-docking protein FtsY [Archaeoglobaceae archaeon]|nr:signal recognition particle-docking protein FtsY [Archaeoglobaceae archaeon]MDW7989720.1 signal recognition particle-docking protein FtsY [Archaeoglobaceae archaeon]